MKITQEGDNKRIELVYNNRQFGWQQLANFVIPEEDWIQFRNHAIHEMLAHESKKMDGVKIFHMEELKDTNIGQCDQCGKYGVVSRPWNFDKIKTALENNFRVIIK